MAERGKKGFDKADGLRAISLDDVPDGGLDALWDQLKSLSPDRTAGGAPLGGVKRTEAEATLQQAEQEAMQAARAVFESMRTEVEQELAGAQDVKNSALDAQREAEKALKQANEIKAAARQKADELAAGAETGAHALAADSNKKAKKRIADAEAKAAKIEADAKTSAEETLRAARLDAERERKSLRAEAIQEIKSVKDAIEGLRVELDEELETQRILTHATRLNVVSSLVAGDATVVMEQRSEPTPGQEAEDAD